MKKINTKIASNWDDRYRTIPQEITPCRVLREHAHLLPQKGIALDLASGVAGNAFYMADLGLKVQAVDISKVVIDQVNERAVRYGLNVKGIVRDVENNGLMDDYYDVIVVSHFLNRVLMPVIIQRLKQGGLLFYQTWVKDKVDEIGPRNPDFLLKKGELLDFCEGLDILHYHEEGMVGDIEKGVRNQAEIIAIRSVMN